MNTKSASWVLASGNAGKLRELALALEPLAVKLRPVAEFSARSPEESGSSFVENALIKARAAAACSGLPALADDSGLEVDVLNGAPGVYSARYAGPGADDQANNERLLRELADIDPPQRRARFRCVIALVQSAEDPKPLLAQGCWEGEILSAPRGRSGFGYDPLFLDPELGLTAAELDPADKLARSHRGQAIRALLEQIRR